MGGISYAHPDVVRGVIAREWLRADAIGSQLGSITLHTHQVDAARRVRALLVKVGGALLCDEVGLGKTYVALAVARLHFHPLVIAPASLRAMWQEAAGRAAVSVRFLSAESLSRARLPAHQCDFVIVDEAHYFRTTSTRRYISLAALTARASVLLVSATPVHNKRSDVTGLLSLFLGSAARALPDSERARYVVRRGQTEAGGSIPRVRDPVKLSLPHDAGRLEQLLGLPPPTPARDGGVAAALVTHSLVRLWASSDAALREGLRRRIAKTIALRIALEEGRHPTSDELRSWIYGDSSIQLGFASILSPEMCPESHGMLGPVQEHERALSELLHALPAKSTADVARVEHLRALRHEHAGTKIVAFSQFTDTVARLYSGMARDGGAAMLTARGARIASGPITRGEAIARFAPLGCGAPVPPASEAISLLIATDLLSEGVNLQDAAVVVHLDLPWTAATLEQRVGRVARMGSRHRDVLVYAMDPPASADRLLRAEAIIRRKARLAAATVGSSRIPPLFAPIEIRPESDVESAEAVRRTLSTWTAAPAQKLDSSIICAAVTADRDAALALVTIRGEPHLVGISNCEVSPSLAAVRALAAAAGGEAAPVLAEPITSIIAQTHRWMESELAASDAGRSCAGRSALAGRIGERLEQRLANCPRHERALCSQRVASALRRLQRPFTLGVEREIEAILRDSTGQNFLDQLERVCSDDRDTDTSATSEIRAVLILRRSCPECDPGGNQEMRSQM